MFLINLCKEKVWFVPALIVLSLLLAVFLLGLAIEYWNDVLQSLYGVTASISASAWFWSAFSLVILLQFMLLYLEVAANLGKRVRSTVYFLVFASLMFSSIFSLGIHARLDAFGAGGGFMLAAVAAIYGVIATNCFASIVSWQNRLKLQR